MKRYHKTTNLDTIEIDGKYYVSTSNKKKYWTNTVKDSRTDAEKEAVVLMLRDAEWRYNQLRTTLEHEYNLDDTEIDNLIA